MAYVRSNVANAALNPNLAVVLNSVASGNLLVVGIVTSSSGTTVTGLTDTAGNVYTRRAPRIFLSGAGGTEIWEAHNVTGGNLTLTATFSASVSAGIVVSEYSGMNTSAPFDKTKSATGTSTAPSTGNAPATTQADELLVGFISYGSGVLTPGAGFTARQTATFQVMFMDRTVSATGTYPVNGTLAASGTWTANMATFKVAAAGGFNLACDDANQ